MQYLLTQQEYDNLAGSAERVKREAEEAADKRLRDVKQELADAIFRYLGDLPGWHGQASGLVQDLREVFKKHRITPAEPQQ